MCGEAPCTCYKGSVKKNSQLFLKEYGFSSVFTLSFTELGILTQSTSFHRFRGFFFLLLKSVRLLKNKELFQIYCSRCIILLSQISRVRNLLKIVGKAFSMTLQASKMEIPLMQSSQIVHLYISILPS